MNIKPYRNKHSESEFLIEINVFIHFILGHYADEVANKENYHNTTMMFLKAKVEYECVQLNFAIIPSQWRMSLEHFYSLNQIT